MIRFNNILEKQYSINCINITAQAGGWSALVKHGETRGRFSCFPDIYQFT